MIRFQHNLIGQIGGISLCFHGGAWFAWLSLALLVVALIQLFRLRAVSGR